MLNVKDLEQFSTGDYSWYQTSSMFGHFEAASKLASEFPLLPKRNPKLAMNPFGREVLFTNQWIKDTIFDHQLSPIWKELSIELSSQSYRQELSDLTRVNLVDLPYQGILWMQESGFSITAHRDSPDKRLSHLIYFSTTPWEGSWGGHLHILESADSVIPLKQYAPTINQSIVFDNKTCPWHACSKMQSHAATRLMLQVLFFE